MENKITRERLNNHFSYDWLKYICIILACILGMSLILAFMGPRISSAEEFEFMIYSNGISNVERENLSDNISAKLRSDIKQSNVMTFSKLTNNDVSVFEARVSSKLGDVYIFQNELPKNNGSEDDEKIESDYLKYVDLGIFLPLEDLLKEGIALKFNDEYQAKIVNFAKNNKNYKTQSKISDLLQREEQRVIEINEISVKLYNMLSKYNHYDSASSSYVNGTHSSFMSNLGYYYERFEQTKRLNPKKEVTLEQEKLWGLWIEAGTGTSTLPNFINLISNGVDENLETKPVHCALGVTDFDRKNAPFEYETLFAIDVLIQKYKIQK